MAMRSQNLTWADVNVREVEGGIVLHVRGREPEYIAGATREDLELYGQSVLVNVPANPALLA